MKTDALIASLAADARRRGPDPDRAVAAATLLAAVAVAVLFVSMFGGWRAGAVASLADPRFALKLAATASVAVAALALTAALARPGAPLRAARAAFVAAAAIGLAGIGHELLTLPADRLLPSLVGSNGLKCLVAVPALGATPLVLLVLALRRAAPVRPGLAGAAAGVLAGAMAATAYATYCPDDSPLFVAVWYTAAVAVLALAGAAAGRRFARW